MAVRRVAPRHAAHRLPAASGGTAPALGRALAHRGDGRAQGRRPHAGRDRRSRYHLRPGHGRAHYRADRVHERPEARPSHPRPTRPHPRLRHAEQPGKALVLRRSRCGAVTPGRPDARDGPARQARNRVVADRLVQRFRRRDPRPARPHQLPRPLRAQPDARVGRYAGWRRSRPVRLLRPLVRPDPPSRAAHRDEPRRLGRRGAGRCRGLGWPRAARAPGFRRRSPRGIRCPLDGHDQPRLCRPPAMGRRRDGRGAYAGSSVPVLQRRIPIAGADPYETFTNPLLRSAGALFVRPDFQYHAPGNGNLRGFRSDLGGRWALTANLELTRSVWRRDGGILRDVALTGFADGGLVDTLAVPPTASGAGRWYTPLYDGGVGLVTRHQIRDLAWTMRLELPVVVSRSTYARDLRPSEGRLALRWQLSLSPSF